MLTDTKLQGTHTAEVTFTGTQATIPNPFPPPYTAVNIIATQLKNANATHNCVLDPATDTDSVVINASAGIYRVTLIAGLPSEVVAYTGV